MKILVTKPQGNSEFDTFFPREVREEIEKLGEVIWNPYQREYTREELCEALCGVDAVFTAWGAHRYDAELLKKADRLKVIAHTGGSVTLLTSDETEKRNITILSGNRLYAESVAEGTVAYILLAQRDLVNQVSEMSCCGWSRKFPDNKGLKKKTIGLVGFGMIAKNVAKILNAFDVTVKVYSSYLSQKEADDYHVQVCSLEEIFKTCDIVSIHSGLNAKTYHMIGKEQLSWMKDNALLVNTARGAVISEDALIEELKTGRIRAILDVYEKEPLPMDSALRECNNAILIPHQGGPTVDVRAYVTLSLVDDLKKFRKGETDFANEIKPEYAKFMTDDRKFQK